MFANIHVSHGYAESQLLSAVRPLSQPKRQRFARCDRLGRRRKGHCVELRQWRTGDVGTGKPGGNQPGGPWLMSKGWEDMAQGKS